MADLPTYYVAENPDNEPVKNMDEFALHMNPQQEGNMNGWIEADVPLLGEMDEPLGAEVEDDKDEEEDPEKEPEEEEIEDEEMVNDEDEKGNEEDEAKVINPYEEVDPHNRPPPTSDEETEFAPPVAQIVDADDVPIPLSVHIGVQKLIKQIHDRYRTEKKMAKKFRQDELRMNGQEFDITALDSAVRENRSENSKMMKMTEGLSNEFTKLKIQNRRAEELSRWEAWVRGIIPNNLRFQEEPSIYTASMPPADDPYVMVRDAAKDTQGDEDDDTNAPWDTQPFEPIMPLKRRSQTNPQPTLTQEAVDQLVRDGIKSAIRAERERVRIEATRAGGPTGGPAAAPVARECSFIGFMKCGPMQFHGTKGVVGLVRWFKKIENTFEIIELYIKGLPEIIKGETTSSRPATLNEAVHMEHALMEQKIQAKNERIAEGIKRKWENNNHCNNKNNNNNNRGNYRNNNRHNQNNNQRQSNARAMTTIQNAGENQIEIAPKYNRCERCHFDQCPPKCDNYGRKGHKTKDCRRKNVASGAIVQSNVVCYECEERGHKSRACPKRADRQGGNVQGQAYVIRDAEHNQGLNVVTGTFLLNNRYATILFDSRAGKSFLDIKFSHLIDIKLVKLNSSYKVKLADGKVVSTNSILRGCTLNILGHLFNINLMLIELGTFDVIVGMDWLVKRDAIIVKKYIERGSQLFIAQVMKKEPAKKQLQDVPVICNFPEVFPDDLQGLPPPRQVEFRIELIPGVAPVARAPYCLAPIELKELSSQLKELLENGFICPSSSPWGSPTFLEIRNMERVMNSTEFLRRIQPKVSVDPNYCQYQLHMLATCLPASESFSRFDHLSLGDYHGGLTSLLRHEKSDNEPLNNMDEFALHMNPQQEGNMNGWIEADVLLLGEMDEPLGPEVEDDKDEEEEPKEEEMEDEEMVNDEDDKGNEEDGAEIAADDDVPIPPVIQFGHNFHIGESSAIRDFFAGNSEVYAPGPMWCDLKSVHMGIKRLIRENRSENSKIMKMIEGLSREFTELKIHNRRAKELRYAAMDTQGDEDDDTNAPWDTQPFEPRGSPCDSQRSQTNPQPTLTQDAADQLVRDGIKAAIRAERDRVRIEATRARGPAGGPTAAPVARECSFIGFMKCGPTQFQEAEGHEVANGRPWTKVKQMMINEFCPTKEVQRLEDKLRHLKLKDMNIAAYKERFNEMAFFCPDDVHSEKKKVELYIKGFPEIIKGETTSSRPATLNEAVRMAHALMEQKIQAKNERKTEGIKRKWENNNQGNNNNNNSNNRGNYRNNNRHNQNNNRRQSNARALTTSQNAGANQTRIAPKCNHCGRCQNDQCPPKCDNYRRIGHKTKDCQSKNMASGATVQSNVVCYECGERGHKSRACPKRADRQGGNVHGQAYLS
uniref:Reverse transcriptase domain-containing protein n=1 Tax=Tanacetum cinerariifolium TaxID=118510 RepID=A0A6L2KZR3_TANCI|nr:hypothetical protein [Tanacetum cinerariifolium]